MKIYVVLYIVVKLLKLKGVSMKTIENDTMDIDVETKNNIIDKLIEDEKCIKKGERTYTREEMNAIIDWTMSRYV